MTIAAPVTLVAGMTVVYLVGGPIGEFVCDAASPMSSLPSGRIVASMLCLFFYVAGAMASSLAALLAIETVGGTVGACVGAGIAAARASKR